jgi:hypothetical protein
MEMKLSSLSCFSSCWLDSLTDSSCSSIATDNFTSAEPFGSQMCVWQRSLLDYVLLFQIVVRIEVNLKWQVLITLYSDNSEFQQVCFCVKWSQFESHILRSQDCTHRQAI